MVVLLDVSVIKEVPGADIRRQKRPQKTRLLSSLYLAPEDQAAIPSTAQKRAGKSCSGEIILEDIQLANGPSPRRPESAQDYLVKEVGEVGSNGG